MTNTNTFLPSSNKPPDFLQATIGDFGRWQCRISLLMAFLKFPIAWFQLGIVFLAPATEFWCRQPEDFKLKSTAQWIKEITPHANTTMGVGCHMLNIEVDGIHRNRTMPCRWGYDYDRSIVHSSIISEWNLVCGRERLVDIVQITFMLGVLLGNIAFGVAADRYGRKKTLMICIITQSIFGILAAWAPWYTAFVVVRFIVAIANGGTVIISFVMCMEVVSGKWRTIIPILYQIPFGIGNSVMAVLAYYIREWRELQLVLSGISTVFIFYYWFLPESPRWLIATKRKNKAILVLEKAARFNRLDETNVHIALQKYGVEGKRENPKFSALFKTAPLRLRTILLCINWFICGIIFFAFSQYIGQIGKNIYFNVFIGGLISIPGTFACILVVNRFGRRCTITIAHLFTGICLFGISVIPIGMFAEDWPRILFAGLGIIGLSVSMPALYLYTGELFPTILRNAGVGGCVMFSKVGSVLAPLVISLQEVFQFLPLVILGFLAILEAVLILPLPESKEFDLPDTINDIELRTLENGNHLSEPNLCNDDYADDLDEGDNKSHIK